MNPTIEAALLFHALASVINALVGASREVRAWRSTPPRLAKSPRTCRADQRSVMGPTSAKAPPRVKATSPSGETVKRKHHGKLGRLAENSRTRPTRCPLGGRASLTPG